MNRTKTSWGRSLKEFFAFWKTNWRGLTPLPMTRHTTINFKLNDFRPFAVALRVLIPLVAQPSHSHGAGQNLGRCAERTSGMNCSNERP